jgi:hypothetical protein
MATRAARAAQRARLDSSAMKRVRGESPLLRPFRHFAQPGSAWWTSAVTFHRRRMLLDVDGARCATWGAIHAIETDYERADEFTLSADLVLWPQPLRKLSLAAVERSPTYRRLKTSLSRYGYRGQWQHHEGTPFGVFSKDVRDRGAVTVEIALVDEMERVLPAVLAGRPMPPRMKRARAHAHPWHTLPGIFAVFTGRHHAWRPAGAAFGRQPIDVRIDRVHFTLRPSISRSGPRLPGAYVSIVHFMPGRHPKRALSDLLRTASHRRVRSLFRHYGYRWFPPSNGRRDGFFRKTLRSIGTVVPEAARIDRLQRELREIPGLGSR